MKKRGMRMRRAIEILAAIMLLSLYPGVARSDSVASLLGNYSISQFARITIDADQVQIDYAIDMAALPALRTLHQADANGDGSTSGAERNAYLKTLVADFARKLDLRIDDKRLDLRPEGLDSSLPSEQSGFSLRIDNRFVADLPSANGDSARQLTFDNENYADRFGWHEVVVTAAPGIAVYDTNAVSTSATEDLHKNPETLPPDGPLNERQIHAIFVQGPLPSGAVALAPRPGHPTDTPAAGTSGQTPGMRPLIPGLGGTWLAEAMNRLAHLLSRPTLPASVIGLALLASLVLGALHAFSPGHGKTVVGAYLVGSRGTPRHAMFLGLTVTITHTLGVFALGLATLFASRYFVPEKVFPVLSFLSGLLVVVIGIIMFRQNWRAARLAGHSHSGHGHDHAGHHHDHGHEHSHASSDHHHHDHDHDHGHTHADHAHGHDHDHVHGHTHADAAHRHDHAHEHAHGHADHHHDHGHAHGHDHSGHRHAGLVHSHGGVEHTHLPPGAQGEDISWRSLLALGVSGGLVPCPSALVLLLAAVAVHRIALGLLLIVAFSIGLAATLTLVGLLFLYARNFFRGSVRSSLLLRLLPIASATLVTCVGAVICYGAVVSAI